MAGIDAYEQEARARGWQVKRIEDHRGGRGQQVEFYAWLGGTALRPRLETEACASEAEAWREAWRTRR